MLFYWFAILTCLSLYGYFIWRLSTKKVGTLFSQKKLWFKTNRKAIQAGGGVIVILITILCYKPLGKTIWCTYKGVEHSVETRRDWLSGVCSYKGPNNAWIPIERLLGFPEGDKDEHEKTLVNSPTP